MIKKSSKKHKHIILLYQSKLLKAILASFNHHYTNKITTYFTFRNGARLPRSVARRHQRGRGAGHSADPGGQRGATRGGQAAHIGGGGGTHGGSSTRKLIQIQ